MVVVYITYIPKGGRISYRIKGSDGRSITVSGSSGGYRIEGHAKSWVYPTYAIMKAVGIMRVRGARIVEVQARVSTRYQLSNLYQYAGITPQEVVVGDERPKRGKVKTNTKELQSIGLMRAANKEKKHPALYIPAGDVNKTKGHRPIKIRGDTYTHFASCSGMMAADYEKKGLQNQGYKVLVRKYGPRQFHVYRGPKRR